MGIKETIAKGAGKLKKAGAVIMGDRGIFKQLKEEHGQVSALMMQVKAGDEDTRAELFPTLRHELLAHSKAEEKEFYALLEQQSKTRDQIARSREEHQEVEQLLDQLSAMDVEDPEWVELFDELVTAVQEHVDREEDEIFAAAQEIIDDERAREIEERFLAQRKREMERLVSGPSMGLPGEHRPTV